VGAGSVASLSLRDDRKKAILRRLEGLAQRRPWRQPPVIVPPSVPAPDRRCAWRSYPAFCRPRWPLREPRPTTRRFHLFAFGARTVASDHIRELPRSPPRGTNRDAGAAAAYYRRVAPWRPEEHELLERAFLSVLAEGDVEEAVRLADQVVKLDKNDRIARLVIGVHALKQKKYPLAKAKT